MKYLWNLLLAFLVIALIVAALVVGFDSPEWLGSVSGFFEGVTGAELLGYGVLGFAAFIPGGFVKFFNWVKSQTGYQDAEAKITMVLMIAAIAVGVNFLIGAYDGTGFAMENVIALFTEVYVLAGVTYQKLKG